MENTQNKKTSEAHIRAGKKYANSKWRPNIYLNKELREDIESHYQKKGYQSFNEYVTALVIADMQKDGYILPNDAE